MPEPLRLLAVVAHPDDESLGLGATLARYAAEGVETFLITATFGDRGRFRGIPRGGEGHPGQEALARIRAAELRAAVAVLGVRELITFGYPDGGLAEVDSLEAMGRIAGAMRRIRPQVVVTFAPDGSYGHPDHIAICQFTTAAAVLAAGEPSAASAGGAAAHAITKLYYMAWGEKSMRAYEAAFRPMTMQVDGQERRSVAWPEWALTTRLDVRAHWPTAWKAICCHESQIASYERLREASDEQRANIWGIQTYYRALRLVPGDRTVETDLFEGVRG